MNPPQDFLDRPILPGQFFTLASRKGTQAEVTVGLVISIDAKDRVVARQAEESWRPCAVHGLELKDRLSLLTRSDRMFIISRDCLPEDVARMLEEAPRP